MLMDAKHLERIVKDVAADRAFSARPFERISGPKDSPFDSGVASRGCHSVGEAQTALRESRVTAACLRGSL
jgi:hypothetical protein